MMAIVSVDEPIRNLILLAFALAVLASGVIVAIALAISVSRFIAARLVPTTWNQFVVPAYAMLAIGFLVAVIYDVNTYRWGTYEWQRLSDASAIVVSVGASILILAAAIVSFLWPFIDQSSAAEPIDSSVDEDDEDSRRIR